MPEELTSDTGFLVSETAQNVIDQLHERLAPVGIQSWHYGVLALLNQRDLPIKWVTPVP